MAENHEQLGAVIDTDVSVEMEKSFLEYAYSVIYSRALPDARDGLKPVQRRIIYQMSQMGLRPDRGHVKSQRVVGDVMGKLHPHGDSAIYDALVRMAQPFAMRVPLIDGHGNFGSLDDGPAAPRYTEARMSVPALDLVRDLDEDVVDFVPNYDSQLTQPSVLPAAFPNLLVNGATGIAVGMATNLPPHNLREVCAAACFLLSNPHATTQDLMRYLPGPDLPSGGTIVGLDGIADAYESGRGTFKTRAKTKIERVTARKLGIVVTELPYMVGPERVIEKIKDAVNSGRLKGISAVTNLTDRVHGLRLVIEVKNGFNPEAVLQKLYRLTPLEDSFGINAVTLVNGQPQTLGLKRLLEVYLEHRMSVILRRTRFRLEKALARLHLVEGLLIAVLDIDDVISIVRSSDDTPSAKARLMDVFEISDTQAEHILSLQLRRLTRLAQIELEAERDSLRATIEQLTVLLEDEDARKQVLISELQDVAERLGTDRRTVLLAEDATVSDVSAPLEVPDSPCWLFLGPDGGLLRADTDHAIDYSGLRVAKDCVRSALRTTTRSTVGLVDEVGVVHKLDVLTVPAVPVTDAPPSLSGAAPARLLVSGLDSRAVALLDLSESAPPFAVATAGGVVKRIRPEHPVSKDSWELIGLSPGDSLVGGAHAGNSAHLVFVTQQAQLLHYSASLVRPQGVAASGMAGISLSEGDRVISFAVVSSEDFAARSVLTCVETEADLLATGCFAKTTPLSLYPSKGRATKGVRCMRFLSGQDGLYGAWICGESPRAVSEEGQPIQVPAVKEKRDGSGDAVSVKVGFAN